MSANPELWRDLDRAVRRRQMRIPATFGSHLKYCAAVERGLLSTEPEPMAVLPSLAAVRRAVDRMSDEPMPPWKPQPGGGTRQNLIALAAIDDRDDDDLE